MRCCARCSENLDDDCFIAENGEYLCEEHSKGIKEVDRDWLVKVKAKIKDKK